MRRSGTVVGTIRMSMRASVMVVVVRMVAGTGTITVVMSMIGAMVGMMVIIVAGTGDIVGTTAIVAWP